MKSQSWIACNMVCFVIVVGWVMLVGLVIVRKREQGHNKREKEWVSNWYDECPILDGTQIYIKSDNREWVNEWGEKRKEPDIERGNGRENELGVGERESGGMSGGWLWLN